MSRRQLIHACSLALCFPSVLYERVVSNNQEDHLLKKLSKPKSIRQPAPISKPVLQGSGQIPVAAAGEGQDGGDVGGASGASSTAGLYVPPRKQYTALLKSDLDTEREAQRDFFHKQRATMTAAHVFT
jgi:hypothetical protein